MSLRADPNLAGEMERFGASDIKGTVENLPVEIRKFNRIGIDDTDRPHSGGGEIERLGGTEPSRSDDQNPSAEKLLLALHPHFAEDELPGITLVLLGGKRHDQVKDFCPGIGERIRSTFTGTGSRRGTSTPCARRNGIRRADRSAFRRVP